MARFRIEKATDAGDLFLYDNIGQTRLVLRQDAQQLRGLLNMEFSEVGPVFEECSADFRSANGREWGCELPPGHDGPHAAPGVDEVEYQPGDTIGRVVERLEKAVKELPEAIRKERRERIATAVLAGLAANPADAALDAEVTHTANAAIELADELIKQLDKES